MLTDVSDARTRLLGSAPEFLRGYAETLGPSGDVIRIGEIDAGVFVARLSGIEHFLSTQALFPAHVDKAEVERIVLASVDEWPLAMLERPLKIDPPSADQRHTKLLQAVKEQLQKSRNIRERSLRARLECQRTREISLHDLMPLDLAVDTIFRRFYAERLRTAVSSRDCAHLDGLAYMIAGAWPIYAYEENGNSFRQVSAEEVSQALFRSGGKEMRFVDGRAPLRRLAVHTQTVGAAVTMLADAQGESTRRYGGA